MSTHHTITLSTKHDLTENIWKDLFEEAGGSMNLGWDDFEASEIRLSRANKRVLFFWTSGGEMDHWAQRLHEGLQKYDSDCTVEYFFDMTGELHGYWLNGALKVEPYTTLYEVVLGEYTEIQGIVHNDKEKFFTVLYGDEVLILTYDSENTISTHNSDFTELKKGIQFDCTTAEGNAVWVICYQGQYYSEDIEHGML